MTLIINYKYNKGLNANSALRGIHVFSFSPEMKRLATEVNSYESKHKSTALLMYNNGILAISRLSEVFSFRRDKLYYYTQ